MAVCTPGNLLTPTARRRVGTGVGRSGASHARKPPVAASVSAMPKPKVLGIVLAGGEGKRLWPLTADRAKPAVPVAGRYRLIDFVLSNFVNSGILKIKVLTQYKSDSLNTHIARGWRLPAFLDFYVEVVPAQQR